MGDVILYSSNGHATHGRWPESHDIKVIDTPVSGLLCIPF